MHGEILSLYAKNYMKSVKYTLCVKFEAFWTSKTCSTESYHSSSKG